MDYTEVKIGMVVDYRSKVGGPVTRPQCTVRSTPWQIGHGEWIVLLNEVTGGIAVESLSEPEEVMNKKEIYDARIKPHINEVIRICIENKIPMTAEFFIPTLDEPTLCVSSAIVEDMEFVPNHILNIVSLQQINRAGLSVVIIK